MNPKNKITLNTKMTSLIKNSSRFQFINRNEESYLLLITSEKQLALINLGNGEYRNLINNDAIFFEWFQDTEVVVLLSNLKALLLNTETWEFCEDQVHNVDLVKSKLRDVIMKCDESEENKSWDIEKGSYKSYKKYRGVRDISESDNRLITQFDVRNIDLTMRDLYDNNRYKKKGETFEIDLLKDKVNIQNLKGYYFKLFWKKEESYFSIVLKLFHTEFPDKVISFTLLFSMVISDTPKQIEKKTHPKSSEIIGVLNQDQDKRKDHKMAGKLGLFIEKATKIDKNKINLSNLSIVSIMNNQKK
jgi:hypothetical protein